MGGVVGEIEKPGFVRRLPCELEEIERVISHRVRGVECPFLIFSGFPPFGKPDEMVRIKKALGAHERAVEFLEPILCRIGGAEMPFTGNEGSIASRSEHLADGLRFVGNHSAIAGAA